MAISPIKEEDLTDLVRMLKKESVCEHLFFGPNTEEETKAYFQPLITQTMLALERKATPENHVFILRRDSDFIGNCALLSNPNNKGNLTIAYTIDDTFWRQGYGNLCCKFLVEYGFEQLYAYRLSCDCMSGNLGSSRILEKNGFVQEGVQQKYWLKNGKYYDNLLYGLTR